MAWLADPSGAPTLAFAIGRRVGNAVVRNRLRRRLREAARQMALPPGTYLISANPAATVLSFQELSAHLRRAVTQVTTRKPPTSSRPTSKKPVTSEWERPLEEP